MSNSPLASMWVQANATNFTKTRKGNKITHITVHHMAGVLSARQCGDIFAKAGRGGSAHYGIGNGGEIAQYVDESDIAWSDANWSSNCTTVSIETSNSSTGGDWPVGGPAYNSLICLVADIAKRNGLGWLTPWQNLFGHKDFSSTACPGPYLYARLQEIADGANRINFPPAPKVEWIPMDTPRNLVTKEGATLVIVPDMNTVKTYGAGVVLECDQKCFYNGKTYIRTKYSTSKGISNGFDFDQLTEVPTPEPEPQPEPEPEPTPEPQPEDDTPSWFIRFIQALGEFFTNLFKKKED